MAETAYNRDMLKTRIAERDMTVYTAVGPVARAPRGRRAWTSVFVGPGPQTAMVWWQFYDEPTTPGGLEEAHNHVVERVRAGTLPHQATGDRRQATEVDEVWRGR